MSDPTPFNAYFKELHAVAHQGDAREESFYPTLAAMLKAVAEKTGRKDVIVTTQPRPTDAGNPDFRLWNGANRIVGYVEAKRPDAGLDAIENSGQLARYRTTFPNLILTNFFEFRLYRNGACVQTVLAPRPSGTTHPHTAPPVEKAAELQALLDRFLDFSLPKDFTAESLAVELAKRTRFLRGLVSQQLALESECLAQEKDAPCAPLTGFFEAFQTYLLGTLTPEDFADFFAQTITYGLFAARTRSNGAFSRRSAFDSIPHTIGVLRDLFRFISLDGLPEQLAWCVDDIAEVLAAADAPGILDSYYRQGKGSDPIVHFYETFLAQYAPELRELRGVYYTPEPVVGYIVRSLHDILKTDFDMPDGLASDGVTLLDPAAGTMTFIARAAALAVTEFEKKYGTGGRADFIRRHILRNFCAFELMMAPYAVGHLKMSFLLEELGHRLGDDERMPFYLTNTLDNEELEQSRLPGFSALARESRLAGKIKQQAPILVILGNPPYSGISSNTGEWITGMVEHYKYVDGRHFGEKKHWLQDDYVKFLRFAQWKIEQSGRGVVGMITNHGYLDNPTFRGMRQSLMQTFDDIYVLDLHGNERKRETCPDGSPDRNVFDIRQGVAIAFLVKHGGKTKAPAAVRHADLYGEREAKYDWLNKHASASTGWTALQPSSPHYLFVPSDDALKAEYLRLIAVSDIFPASSVGIVTANDKLTIQFTADEVWRNVTSFAAMREDLARQKVGRKDSQSWQVAQAQKDLLDSGPAQTNITPILYRPFDMRHTYYTGRSNGFMARPMHQIMRQMLAGENLALCVGRQGQVIGAGEWSLCFCSKTIEDFNLFYRGGNVNFPLYLYPEHEQPKKSKGGGGRYVSMMLFEPKELYGERQPNLNPAVVDALAAVYGKVPTPEAIFHYVYAVLYAPAYRTKYAEFLKINFPRIPFTSDAKLFKKLSALGEKLVALHLLQSPDLNPPACRFEGDGNNRVEKTGLRYADDEERVYINAAQHFAPVPVVVWAYQIGGYQVCEKWLKDRQERHLELDDITAYCRIVTALGRTMALQQQINGLYSETETKIITMPSAETPC
ncbi:MAG TPA: N-6 DNA methylase [Lentisphaeria bacterium]|nr:N-6 DNA methylase [Lentisphaeria bacterium]